MIDTDATRPESEVSEALVRSVEIALVVLLLVSPLLVSTYLKQVFNTPKYVLVGFVGLLLGIIHLVDCLFEQRLRLPRNPAGWCLLGFVAWAGLSMLWSSDMAVASRDFGYHSAMLAVFMGAFLYGREEERVDNLLHFPIAAGVLAAGYGLLQYYGIDLVLFKRIPGWAVPAVGSVAMYLGGLVHRETAAEDDENDGEGAPEEGENASRRSPFRHNLYFNLFHLVRQVFQGPGARNAGRGSRGQVGEFLAFVFRPVTVLAIMAGLAAGFQDAAVQALGFLVVCLWVFLRSLEPERNPPLTLVLRGLVGLILILLSKLLDGSILLSLTAAILLDEAANLEHDGEDRASWLLSVGFLACTLTAAMKGWRLDFLVLPKKPEEVVKIYSLMGHRNYLAGFLIAVMPLAIVRLLAIWCVPAAGESRFTPGRIWKSGIYLVTVILMGLVIVLCQTRGAWIGGIVSLGFLAVWLILKYRPLRPFGLLGAVVGGVTIVVVGFGWKTITLPGGRTLTNPLNLHPKSVGVRAAESLDIQHGSAFQRALIYRTTWRIIFDHPINCLFGTGIGTFGLNYMPAQKYVLRVPSNKKYLFFTNKSIYAHNEYWHYWSEVGLVGLLLLFGFLYNLGTAAHRRLREENAGVPNLMFLGMCASLLATVVHNVFTFDWHLAYSGAVFFVLSGILLAQADPRFWTWSWRPGYRGRSEHKGVSATLAGESIERSLVVVVQVDPAPDAGSLVLSGPGSVKVPLEDLGEGQFAGQVEEDYGKWKIGFQGVQVGGDPSGLAPIAFQVRPPGSGFGSVLGLLVLILVGVPLAQSLANDVMRDYYWRNGFLKFRMRRFEEAFLDLEKAVDADPTKGEVLFDFGRALMDSGRNEPAIKVFKQAKATFVDPANDHNIALCYFKMGNRVKAEEHYRKALSLNEIYEQSMANLGYMLIQDGRDADARDMLEQGAELFPRNGRFATSLAILHTRGQNLPEAAKWYDKAIALGPKRAAVYLNAGGVYYSLGQVGKAQEAFRKAVEKEPQNRVAKEKLALVELAQSAKAAKENPQDLAVRRRYALTLLATGQAGAAATEAKNLLQVFPGDSTLRFVYARALEAQGYYEDAIQEYARVDNVPDAPEILQRAQKRRADLIRSRENNRGTGGGKSSSGEKAGAGG